MKAFLTASAIPGIWAIAAIELVLSVIMFISFRKNKSKVILLGALITIGLFIDAFLIGLGAFVDIEAIRGISRIRFISHGILIPLLFAICALALNFKKPWSTIVFVFTALVMVAGLAESLATVLDVTEIAGISRMAAVKELTPAWATGITNALNFGTVIPLMIVGIIAWVKYKTPTLFLGGFLMFAFSALGPASGNKEFIFYISMFGEVLMVLFIYFFGLIKYKKDSLNAK